MRLRSLLTPLVAAVAALAVAVPASAGTRPQWVGAHQGNNLPAWTAMNAAVGPSQVGREFFSGALPATWDGAWVSQLPGSVLATVSYKTPDVNVASFVASIPADRAAPVWMVFHHEPEGPGEFPSGAAFVAAFVAQSAAIRAACAAAGNCAVVKVGMIAGSYQYGKPDRNGWDCSYIPPGDAVDGYFLDAYQANLGGLAKQAFWARWNLCLGAVPAGVVTGITEYGLGTCNPGGQPAPEAQRVAALSADAAYLAANYPDLYVWMYWNHSDPEPCRGWQMTPAMVGVWQGIEAGTTAS